MLSEWLQLSKKKKKKKKKKQHNIPYKHSIQMIDLINGLVIY